MKQSLFPSASRCRIPQKEDKLPTSFSSTKSKQQKQTQKQRDEQEICSSSRDPFEDLSNGGGSITLNVASSNASSSVSSIEAPRGCLRFFLNHSSKPTSNNSNRRKNNNQNQNQNHRPVKLKPSISSAKTPNSAPSSRPTSEGIRKGNAKPSSRVSTLKKSVGTRVSKIKSGSGDAGKSDLNSTPLRSTGDVSGLNVAGIGGVVLGDSSSKLKSNSESSNTKTPPLHSTVSPEIQSVMSTAKSVTTITPVCYAAGHLLSGVTDKRKCRPRGLLVVGEDMVVDKFDIDDHDSGDDVNNTAIDLSPSALPVKASMHWLHSPDNSSDVSPEFGGFVVAANRSSDMDISPLEDSYPLSMDLLSSVNVVQTPESDSSFRVRDITTKGWGSELDSVDRHLQKLFSTPSDPVDLLQLQKSIDIRDSQLSTSTSRSEVRISWRDGLVSRIFELDELDCCRCLSDEEGDMEKEENDSKTAHLESHQTHKQDELRNDKTPNARIDTPDGKHCLDGNVKDDELPCLPAAESMAISSDGGALFQSDDSDWTQCYKNQLFKV
ncbi:hypothetical protein LINGRAHAP2_LOCUS33304 [Linum grandiflorum]